MMSVNELRCHQITHTHERGDVSRYTENQIRLAHLQPNTPKGILSITLKVSLQCNNLGLESRLVLGFMDTGRVSIIDVGTEKIMMECTPHQAYIIFCP